MREVAVVSFAQTEHRRRDEHHNEVELLMPVLRQVKEQVGLGQRLHGEEIDFTCSGSTDYLAGSAFSFVVALDGVGAWPPISESHVEMDAAWALYEAWVKIQTGEADTALVYGYGKSSPGSVRDVLSRQLDPYYVAPLWADSVSLAALQARACLDAGVTTLDEMAAVAERSRTAAQTNPYAQLRGSKAAAELLSGDELASPLRRHDCPPVTDGAAAVILAAGDRARALCDRPAWVTGMDHRVDAHSLGVRDLTASPSTRMAGERAGVGTRPADVAELHAPFTHQEVILRHALDLEEGTSLNPSGGALAANPLMAAGLIRVGEAARRIHDGDAERAVAHATSGPCLQQNLVCVMDHTPVPGEGE